MSVLNEWIDHPDNDTIGQVAARFDLPEAWAMMHVGEHRCVDQRTYRASCLVSDPTTHDVAQSYMAKFGVTA